MVNGNQKVSWTRFYPDTDKWPLPQNGNELLSERNRAIFAAVIVYILTNDKDQLYHDFQLSVGKSEAREYARKADLYWRLRDKKFPRNQRAQVPIGMAHSSDRVTFTVTFVVFGKSVRNYGQSDRASQKEASSCSTTIY